MGSYDGGGKMGHNSTQTGAGGPQGTGGASRSGAAQAGRAAALGGTKKAGTSAVADHMIATGQIGARSIPAGGVARGNFNTQDDAYGAYSKAVGDYATRGAFGRVADFLAGPWYDQNEPMAGNPRSFSGGTWHSSSNPYGAAMGLASPFGSGAVTGPLAGKLGHAAGLPDVWHGGYDQPDVRPGVLGNAPAGTDIGKTFAEMGGTHAGLHGGGSEQTSGFSNTGGGTIQSPAIPGPLSLGLQAQKPAIPGPIQPTIFPKPPTFSQYNVPGGNPYSVNLFGRAA